VLKDKTLINMNNTMRLGVRLLLAVFSAVAIFKDTILGKKLVTTSFPFNQLLGNDSVPVKSVIGCPHIERSFVSRATACLSLIY
jgi:hypothetical protein